MAVGDQFRGLPLKDLIGTPLMAASDSNIDLANGMAKFVNILAFGKQPDGNKVVTVPMTLQRPVQEADGSIGVNEITVTPPLLGLVTIPALLVDTVDIQFSMEVTTHEEHVDSKDTEVSVDASAKFGWGFWSASVKMHGKVATHRENTRSTDVTAKYDVRVHASQQPPTEGMSKLMDLLASTVEPIKSVAAAPA